MKQKRTFNYWTLITLLILTIFIFFFVYPISRVFVQSVYNPQTHSLDFSAFKEFFAKPYYTDTIWNSLKVSTVATIIATLMGLILAYILRRVEIKGRKVLEILIIASIISPPFIGAYSWIILLGRQGIITKVINAIFGIKFGGLYGFWGIVMTMALKMFPLVYLYMSGALKSIDNSLNEAGHSLGSDGKRTFWTITIPLVLPTLLSSALLVFMRSLADFGTPMLIGEGYRTLPILIYQSFVGEVSTNIAFGSAIAVIIVVTTIIIFLIQDWIANKQNVEMTALRPMEPQKETGFLNFLSYFVTYFLVFITMLPTIVVVYTSFLEEKAGFFTNKFSLESYRFAFERMGQPIKNTFVFSTISIIIIVVIGVLIAYISVRQRNAFSKLLDSLTMMPYVVPGSVMGVGLLGAFNKSPFLLMGTSWILIIAFVIRRLPYTVRSSTTILKQIDPNIEEASQSLGASSGKTFLKISVPTMAPGIISGAIMSWMTTITELSASILLYVSSTRTLSTVIYQEVLRGNYGIASALSSILLLTTSITLLIFFKITGNSEINI